MPDVIRTLQIMNISMYIINKAQSTLLGVIYIHVHS